MPGGDESPEIISILREGRARESCCEYRKCIGALNIVTTILYAFYYTYLIWMLAHLKSNTGYYALISLPLFCDIMLLVIFICCHGYEIVMASLQAFRVTAVVLTLMSTFTLLTRHAVYHISDSSKDLMGINFIMVSLKGSVIVFLWDLLSQRNFSLPKIMKDKDVITHIILDNVDIFNMVDVLFVKCAADVPVIAEGSALEIIIQTFCTLSFSICWAETLYVCVTECGRWHPLHQTFSVVYYISVFLQNIPFFIIRLCIWVKYDLFSLGFLVKNLLAIIFGIVEILSPYFVNVQGLRDIHVN